MEHDELQIAPAPPLRQTPTTQETPAKANVAAASPTRQAHVPPAQPTPSAVAAKPSPRAAVAPDSAPKVRPDAGAGKKVAIPSPAAPPPSVTATPAHPPAVGVEPASKAPIDAPPAKTWIRPSSSHSSQTATSQPTREQKSESTAELLQKLADEGNWESWEKQVFAAYNDGFRIVTLIGFSSAGKTFFANRLRRQLRFSPDWTVWPSEAPNIPRTDQLIEWTQMVKHGRHPSRFLLGDVDGEAYRSSVGRLLGDKKTEDHWQRFLLLTALASAYILMIPARTALDAPDGVGTERLVDHFDIIVGVILAIKRRVLDMGGDLNAVRAAIREPITDEDSWKALRETKDCPQPVHVLFAQADTFGEIAASESDPYLYAAHHAGSLYQIINKHFATHRFDFVSAFAGYQKNNDFFVDYKCPSYGAAAAFDWITRMASGGRLSRGSTAAAKITRRLLDGTFRKATRMVRR